jgi:DNA sulfur modification protein DndC
MAAFDALVKAVMKGTGATRRVADTLVRRQLGTPDPTAGRKLLPGVLAMVPKALVKLRDQGALFAVSHSGGKDSQAMYYVVSKFVPPEQMAVFHAPLGEVEWAGTEEHIRENIDPAIPYVRGVARIGTTMKTNDLLAMVRKRGKWPDHRIRQCTSDLKVGPINRELRRFLKRHPDKFRTAQAPGGLVVECLGIRAGESDGRAAKEMFSLNASESTAQAWSATGRVGDGKVVHAVGRGGTTLCGSVPTSSSGATTPVTCKSCLKGREQWTWYPIFTQNNASDPGFNPRTMGDDVFGLIEESGQQPYWTYAAGMTRMSCSFCILSRKSDLIRASELRPELYAKYVALEADIGHTIKHKKTLEEFTGVEADQALVRKFRKTKRKRKKT